MVGGGPHGLRAGEWTDDTAMALALADSLLHDPALDAVDLMRRFVDWHERGAYSCTGTCFDIGIATRQALDRFRRTGNPWRVRGRCVVRQRRVDAAVPRRDPPLAGPYRDAAGGGRADPHHPRLARDPGGLPRASPGRWRQP